MTPTLRLASLASLVLVGACTTIPSGPSVMVLPGTGKNFDQFRADEYECRQYAGYQAGGMSASEAATDSGVKSAAVGTVVGAAAGAAINGGSGAAVGAGVGLLAGALAGTSAGSASAYSVQQRYDYGYTQCMYSKGHRIPVSGRFTSSSPSYYRPPAPGAPYGPPPPPPPPPPPR
jgi:hypothetical protein